MCQFDPSAGWGPVRTEVRFLGSVNRVSSSSRGSNAVPIGRTPSHRSWSTHVTNQDSLIKTSKALANRASCRGARPVSRAAGVRWAKPRNRSRSGDQRAASHKRDGPTGKWALEGVKCVRRWPATVQRSLACEAFDAAGSHASKRNAIRGSNALVTNVVGPRPMQKNSGPRSGATPFSRTHPIGLKGWRLTVPQDCSRHSCLAREGFYFACTPLTGQSH
jgi:hypothetical protein